MATIEGIIPNLGLFETTPKARDDISRFGRRGIEREPIYVARATSRALAEVFRVNSVCGKHVFLEYRRVWLAEKPVGIHTRRTTSIFLAVRAGSLGRGLKIPGI